MLDARHYAKFFAEVVLFNPHNYPMCEYYDSHFMDEEIKAHRG